MVNKVYSTTLNLVVIGLANELERLQKVIAQSGLTSRRKAEQLIVAGKVKVNNQIVTKLGTKVSNKDDIKVNDIPIEREEPVYFLFYKPREVISSVADEKQRKVVTDYFPEIEQRIYPIGRLDYQTSGILLLTNDGHFANLLMHPRYEIDKVYVAKVKGILNRQTLNEMRKGVTSDGDLLRAIHAKILSVDRQTNHSIIEITLHEGKNRHVRRMMEALNHPVVRLKRETYGILTLAGLQPGDYRRLTPHEVKLMRELALRNVKK